MKKENNIDGWKLENSETGEVLDANEAMKTSGKREYKITKLLVDNMLSKAKVATDIDIKMLYSWCRANKFINNYGQIQTFGNKLNNDIEDLLVEEGVICAFVLKAIKTAHPFSGLLKINHKRFISTWGELWEAIHCKGRRDQTRVKKFLVSNGLIDKFRISDSNHNIVSRLVLNPYLYKGASHSGQLSCILWQEYAKESINVNMYAYRWLQGMGYLK